MDEVILLFPSGQTSVNKRVKKVTKAQAAAVRTLANAPKDVREAWENRNRSLAALLPVAA